jgi:hypothetical protein
MLCSSLQMASVWPCCSPPPHHWARPHLPLTSCQGFWYMTWKLMKLSFLVCSFCCSSARQSLFWGIVPRDYIFFGNWPRQRYLDACPWRVSLFSWPILSQDLAMHEWRPHSVTVQRSHAGCTDGVKPCIQVDITRLNEPDLIWCSSFHAAETSCVGMAIMVCAVVP